MNKQKIARELVRVAKEIVGKKEVYKLKTRFGHYLLTTEERFIGTYGGDADLKELKKEKFLRLGKIPVSVYLTDYDYFSTTKSEPNLRDVKKEFYRQKKKKNKTVDSHWSNAW